MKVLIVDDNRLLATILADHLIAQGHEAVAAFDGRLAEIFCDRDHYDLIVLDMVLPELDGVDLLERLRHKRQHCRVIIITGFSELHEQERAHLESLGVAAVLEKPFSFADVDAILERIVD
jgi:DNA-binding response OmpR family regulator